MLSNRVIWGDIDSEDQRDHDDSSRVKLIELIWSIQDPGALVLLLLVKEKLTLKWMSYSRAQPAHSTLQLAHPTKHADATSDFGALHSRSGRPACQRLSATRVDTHRGTS